MIHAKQALLDEGWAANVRLTVDAGTIVHIEKDAGPQTSDSRVDTLLPALGNLHSHAFQRAGTVSGPGGTSCTASWTA